MIIKEYNLLDPIPTDAVALVFDIEADGLLDTVTKIHCGWSFDINSKKHASTADEYVGNTGSELLIEWLEHIQGADYLIGHNIIGYDIPCIKKLYPWFNPKGILIDTLILSQLGFPDRYTLDNQMIQAEKLTTESFKYKDSSRLTLAGNPTSKNCIGRHSLKSWGIRMGNLKGDYDGGWEEWSEEMHTYCKQDVDLNYEVFIHLMKNTHRLSSQSLWIEHEVERILGRQKAHGVLFDLDKARDLYGTLLEKRQGILEKILETLGNVTIDKFYEWTPKSNNEAKGFVKGKMMIRNKGKEVPFNPASTDHIVWWFKKKYQWIPVEFTKATDKFPAGQPSISEEILLAMPYPEAKLLAEWMMLDKRVTFFDGKGGWFNYLNEDTHRIHGDINSRGTVTGRMTHSKPNLAQVPKNAPHVPYGKECRELFTVPEGKLMVGCDASGLELRMLAHHMNDEQYTKTVCEGSNEDGTDVHSVNMRAAGLANRDTAKTFIYCYIYGGGDAKVGSIIGKGSGAGRALKAKFLAGLPALDKLQKLLLKVLSTRNYINQIDGRRIPIRSKHSSLNFLLQGLGAIVMKVALILLDHELQKCYIAGKDYEFVINCHDEFGIECSEDIAEDVGKKMEQSIRDAGTYLNLNCSLDAEAKIGKSWAETH